MHREPRCVHDADISNRPKLPDNTDFGEYAHSASQTLGIHLKHLKPRVMLNGLTHAQNILIFHHRILTNNNATVFKITAGAGANAPSESLGFYLGGYKTASNRAVTIVDGPDELEQSSSLIIVNTTSQSDSFWTIPALPNGIRSRTRAMVNWIPVGSQGMLVVVGGALNPIDLMNSFQPWDNNTMEQGNNFTQEILLYDIASTRWFVQDIKEGSSFPTRLTQACSVVATRFDDTYTHRKLYCQQSH